MVALCVLPMLAVGFLDAGWASAGSHDMGATTFGLARQSAENPSASDVSPDTVQDKSDADVLAVEDVAEEAALKTASSRDVSAGVQEIADEEEAARLAAEEAARVAEQEAIDRADATRSRYYATFGSLPAGDVDFSIGREAFIEEWSARINDYLFGSPLSGHGETFAEAAWEAGIDPRWSPAISNTESTKGRVCFKSHNAWGWDQTNWSDSDDKNCITKLYIGKLYAVESGRHHIGKHARVDNINVFRKQRKVSIGIIYMKEFRKDTIFEVGEFPACQHSAGVHGITSLCFQRIPVRSDGRHKNPVSRFEIFYELSDFHNLCTALMAQDHVVTVADSAFP